MSTDLMTLQEAARHLDVCEKTVRNYVKNGYLSGMKKARSVRVWLDPAEVESFRIEKAASRQRSVVSREEVLQMKARLRRLESQVRTLLTIMDAKNEPLDMPSGYARDLHASCVEQLKYTGWDIGEMETWVSIFLRIDEDDFETIFKTTEDPKPWLPFMQLCASMTAHVAKHENYATSLELQAIHRELVEGRRRMRVSLVCFAETFGSISDPDARRLLAAPGTTLLDAVETNIRGRKSQ